MRYTVKVDKSIVGYGYAVVYDKKEKEIVCECRTIRTAKKIAKLLNEKEK